MANPDIVSANDSDLASYGGSATTINKWTYNANPTMTDAQGIAGVQANPLTAALATNATAPQKAKIALAILVSIIAPGSGAGTVALSDLNTVSKRKFFRMKRSVQDWVKFLDQVQG